MKCKKDKEKWIAKCMPLALVTVDVFWRGVVRGPMMTRALRESDEFMGSYFVSGALTVESLLKIFGLEKERVAGVDVQSRGVVRRVDLNGRLEDFGVDERSCLVLVHLEEGVSESEVWRMEAAHSLDALQAWSSRLQQRQGRVDEAGLLVGQA